MVSSTTEARTRRLLDAPLTLLGRFGQASNATFLVWLGDEPPAGPVDVDELDAEHLAVYKPRHGERPLWDFPEGTLHRREVAARVVSEALGWGLVPETVLRDEAPHGRGSLQRFVPHDPDRHYFRLLEDGGPAVLAQLEEMVVFDLVIDNADRKAGHVLLEGDRIRLVDHGVSLNADPKLRTVAWDFATEPIPIRLRRTVGELADRLAAGGPPTARLERLLNDDEVAALTARARRVADSERYPEPTGPRPYPWPLV